MSTRFNTRLLAIFTVAAFSSLFCCSSVDAHWITPEWEFQEEQAGQPEEKPPLAADKKESEAESKEGAEEKQPAVDPFEGYRTFADVQAELQKLAGSELAELTSLGKTAQNRDIWLLTLSTDHAATRPAILIVGNVWAPHLLGRELALRLAKSIIESHAGEADGAKDLLNQFTIYVIPSPTPDASEKNFDKPLRERTGNSTATDDDRDFSAGEDGPADLNGDGWITMMRVADPFGSHRPHDKDQRVMVPIDASKAEAGTHRIYIEARDADGDKQFGEDGSDGVDFNRNFTFNYPYFGKGAGPHQVSEIESRVIAEFMFDHPNIGAVFCFSPEDNLIHPWKGSTQTDGARIKTKILTKDQAFTDRLAAKFKEFGGNADIPSPPSGAGSFSEWVYYHYGRWSFASRGWAVPKKSDGKGAAEKKDGDKKEEGGEGKATGDANPDSGTGEINQPPQAAPAGEPAQAGRGSRGGGRGMGRGGAGGPPGGGGRPAAGGPSAAASGANLSSSSANTPEDDLAALAWFEKNKIEGFVDWQPFDHPDFKGKQVEIGGFKPFFRLNPPASQIDGLVKPHLDLIGELTRQWPKIEITEVKAKKLGPGIYEVRCKIVNAGQLPTMPLMGEINRQSYPIMVELTGADNVRWLQGSRRVSVSRLEAQGGSQEIVWMLHLNGEASSDPQYKIRAIAPTLQTAETGVEWSVD